MQHILNTATGDSEHLTEDSATHTRVPPGLHDSSQTNGFLTGV